MCVIAVMRCGAKNYDCGVLHYGLAIAQVIYYVEHVSDHILFK